jgi:DNA-binding NtrC family response regulator
MEEPLRASFHKQNTHLPGCAVRRPHILLVDEGAGDRDHYRQLLRDNGFDVWTCSNYDDGMHCLDSKQFDGIVVDQGSPAFEGRRVLEHSVTKDRRLPVIVITRYHNMGCYLEAMQLGAVDYLEKPLTAHEIIRVLKTHLPSGSLAA